MSYTSEQRLWREFLEKYKSFKCLWQKQETGSYTVAECDAAWQELIELCKEIYVDADKAYVQRRIKNFRTVCQREKKKMKAAERTGKQYTPKIYYFDILKSICDETEDLTSDAGLSSTALIENTDIEAVAIKKEIDFDSAEEESVSKPATKRVRLNPARILARRMAEHLEQMDADQALIAEKIISDICVYGRLKQLNMESSIVLE